MKTLTNRMKLIFAKLILLFSKKRVTEHTPQITVVQSRPLSSSDWINVRGFKEYKSEEEKTVIVFKSVD